MDRDAAIACLRAHEAELQQPGVRHLFLFGSTARNEAAADSDVDLFFDDERGKLGLYELMDVKEAAARILGRKTNIMTRDSLHKTLRRSPIPRLTDIIEAIALIRVEMQGVTLEAIGCRMP